MIDFKTLVAPYARALPGREHMAKIIHARARQVVALRAKSPNVRYVNDRPLETEDKDGWVIRYLRIECEVGAEMDALDRQNAAGEITPAEASACWIPLRNKLRDEHAGVVRRCEPLETKQYAEGVAVWEACVMMEREGMQG